MNFFYLKKVSTAIKLERGGGGGQILNDNAIIKKETFLLLRLPLVITPGKKLDEQLLCFFFNTIFFKVIRPFNLIRLFFKESFRA